MIAYGVGPSAEEIEVVVFGPGIGEAIAAHLGEGKWILIDSCEGEKDKAPASGEYLDSIGVDPSQVIAIVATHWHDDHVRAISNLAEKYASAAFFISGVLREQEAAMFLATYGGKAAPGQSGGTKELAAVIRSRQVKPVNSQTCVIDQTLNGRNVKVYALSPLPDAYRKAAAHLGKYLPAQNQPINKAPAEPSPNAASIVLHIDFGGEAVLLGADLEDNGSWGWTALAKDPWTNQRPVANAYKVAHHGSKSGDVDLIWTDLLAPEPLACVTQFMNGCHNLPTDEDRTRIKSKTKSAFITSDASRKPAIEADQLKRLSTMCTNIKRIDTGLGAVRIRKKIDAPLWNVETFGAARKL